MKIPNIKSNKTKLIVGLLAVVLVPAIFYSWGYSNGKKPVESDKPKYEEVDVNGLVISEACEKIREKGWKVSRVVGVNGGYETDKSDCSDNERKVYRTDYYEDTVSVVFESDIKYEEDKPNDEQSNNTESESNNTTVAQADNQDSYKMPDDISIYDIKEICERYAESKGYSNAEVKDMQGFDLEDGKRYRINGTLYIDEGVTSAEKSVGSFFCVADYNEWQVKSATLNQQNI